MFILWQFIKIILNLFVIYIILSNFKSLIIAEFERMNKSEELKMISNDNGKIVIWTILAFFTIGLLMFLFGLIESVFISAREIMVALTKLF